MIFISTFVPLFILMATVNAGKFALPAEQEENNIEEESKKSEEPKEFFNSNDKLKEFVRGHPPEYEIRPYSSDREIVLVKNIRYMSDVKLISPKERTAVKPLRHVACKPLPSLVTLQPNKEHGEIQYSPNLVRINRCSGQGDRYKACLPTKVELVRYKVGDRVLTGWNKIKDTKKDIIVLEHLACSHQCILKKEDCRDFELYDNVSCTCNCKQEKICKPEYWKGRKLPRVWEQDTCSCECENKDSECSTSHVFSHQACRCVYEE